jgi:hypothetical protein
MGVLGGVARECIIACAAFERSIGVICA